MNQDKSNPARLDSDGRERPNFIDEYPKTDPGLNALVDAFEHGDFRTAGQGAKRLLAQAPEPAVRAAAADLLRRTQPDPLVRLFLLAAVLLFTFLAGWSYLQTPGN